MSRLSLLLLPLPLFLLACEGDGGSTTPKTASENEKTQWQSAANLKDSGDLAGAAGIYESIASENKKSVDAEIELAIIDRKLGKAADAVEVMKDAQNRQPDNQEVTMQLAYALMDAGHSEEAVAIFDSIIRKDPADVQAYSGKGIAFDKAGNHLAAQDIYKQALQLAPHSLSIENNLAMSLILNNQLDQAAAILEKLLAEHPENKTVRHNLALAYGLNGNSQRALNLNLKDLTPEQAKENGKFYKYYAHMREEFDTSDTSGMQIGFTETPADDKNITPAIVKHKKTAKKSVHVAEPVADEDAVKAPELKPAATISAVPAELAPPVADPTATTSGNVLPTSDNSEDKSDFPTQHRR